MVASFPEEEATKVSQLVVLLRFVCCGFDLYFLGMGLGVWIIVGITLNLCSVFLVLGVLFLWFHGPRSDLLRQSVGHRRKPMRQKRYRLSLTANKMSRPFGCRSQAFS
jgi:hypothetical protein